MRPYRRAMASRTALVTGANQNLGRALVAGLAAGMTPADRVLLTGRDPGRVATAARELSAARSPMEPSSSHACSTSVIRAPSDDLAAEVGEVDIVFSNAAARMSPDDDPADAVDVVADTNNVATNMILREFAPRIRAGRPTHRRGERARHPRQAASLGAPPVSPMQPTAGLDAVDRLVDEWRQSVKAGRAVDDGFGSWLNIPSKVAQVAAVRAVALDPTRRRRSTRRPADGPLPRADRHRRVTAVVRGHERSADARAAAAWPVELALSDQFDPAYYGELVQFGTVLPWESGTPVRHHAIAAS